MFNFLSYLLRKRRVKNVALLDSSSENSRVQNAQFVSFLQKSGFRERQLDRHERVRLFKKFVAVAFCWIIFGGVLWVVVESAQALERF
jgi:hypothetical protein